MLFLRKKSKLIYPLILFIQYESNVFSPTRCEESNNQL